MEAVRELYETTNLSMQAIASKAGVSYAMVRLYTLKHYSNDVRRTRSSAVYALSKRGDKNPMIGKRGAEHHNYVGVVSDSKGYLMVLKPAWYSTRKNSKHVFQHHVVVCQALNITGIQRGWCVHHVNGIKTDNRFENLVLLTVGDHCRLHQTVLKGATTISKESTLKWVEAQGTPYRRDDIVCSA